MTKAFSQEHLVLLGAISQLEPEKRAEIDRIVGEIRKLVDPDMGVGAAAVSLVAFQIAQEL